MKKLLLKTDTVISANICENGLNIYVKSPEIAQILGGGNNFALYLWNKREEMEKLAGQSIPFDDLVKYFAAPEEEKNDYLKKIIGKNFWTNVTRFIKRKYIDRLYPNGHEITISSESYVYHDRHLNLSCLFDPGIADGKNFVYKGIYNTELIKTTIIPLLRGYACALIKTFNSAALCEHEENKAALEKEKAVLV